MILLYLLTALVVAAGREPERIRVFEGQTLQYQGFRIPALVMTPKGTLLAFCAARKSMGDWDPIDIIMRRSMDRGVTWEEPRVIAQRAGMTTDNPSPIVDRVTGSVHFLFQVNYAQLYYMRTDDEGKSFSEPADITAVMHGFRQGWVRSANQDRYGWTVMAPGPGHAIQHSSGRLIVPVWMSPSYTHRPSEIATIYSDDHGKTWKRGELVPQTLRHPSEHVAVELTDGSVMLNIRSEGDEHRRAVSISKDGATGWSKPELADELYEPVCMASLIPLPRASGQQKNRLLFANPYSQRDGGAPLNEYNFRSRANLTLRLSYDEGKTWPVAKLLQKGMTGYSDMAVASNGDVFILYEHVKDGKVGVTFTTITVEWLTDGKDRFQK